MQENVKKDAALKQSVRGLSPEALGALIKTLLCSPNKLVIKKRKYDESAIKLAQQLSMARLINLKSG